MAWPKTYGRNLVNDMIDLEHNGRNLQPWNIKKDSVFRLNVAYSCQFQRNCEVGF